MTEPKGKSNLQLFNEQCDLLVVEQAKYDAMTNKETKTAINKLAKINKVCEEINRLSAIKDEQRLSETTIKHLVHVYAAARYKRHKGINNRYITKGLAVEEDSMTLYCRVRDEVFFKNEQHFANDHIQGTPDIVYDEIVDIKSSWDLYTFLPKTVEEIDDLYYWQGQSYMALTGAKVFRLAYCLVNTPNELLEQEKRQLMYKLGGDNISEMYIKACEEIDHNGTYNDIPKEERVIEIIIERNDADIERLYKRIEQCRKWLNEYAQAQERRFTDNRTHSITLLTGHDNGVIMAEKR